MGHFVSDASEKGGARSGDEDDMLQQLPKMGVMDSVVGNSCGVQRKARWACRGKLNWPGFKEREKEELGKTPAEIGQIKRKRCSGGFLSGQL